MIVIGGKEFFFRACQALLSFTLKLNKGFLPTGKVCCNNTCRFTAIIKFDTNQATNSLNKNLALQGQGYFSHRFEASFRRQAAYKKLPDLSHDPVKNILSSGTREHLEPPGAITFSIILASMSNLAVNDIYSNEAKDLY